MTTHEGHAGGPAGPALVVAVGVGADAAGLRRFIDGVRSNGAVALLLDRADDAVPAVVVDAPIVLEGGRIYAAAPGRHLRFDEAGHLHAVGDEAIAGSPLDDLLSSLASQYGDRAAAALLAGAHGATGARAVRAAGGLVLVESAEADAARRPGDADYVVPAGELVDALLGYARQIGGRGGEDRVEAIDAESLIQVLSLVRARTRHDFRGYREKMLRRRIARRMALGGLEDPIDYLALLRQSEAEAQRLVHDLLIGVTGFFRDPEAFEVLDRLVIPEIAARRDPVRAWVAGCATGEEAYSIAMLLLDAVGAEGRPVQVFATDVDAQGLEIARRGVYEAAALAGVPPALRERWFVPAGPHRSQVRQALRDVVVFARQNLLSDPPFSRLDLVSCRNVLIYLRPEVQADVLGMLHFALNDDGHLFLGAAENTGRQSALFRPVSKVWRLYRRAALARGDRLPALPRTEGERRAPTPLGVAPRAVGPDPGDVARRLLLTHYTPPAVLVDGRFDVQYMHGNAGRFLELPSGEPTRNLLAMAPDGLRRALRSCVRTAVREERAATAEATWTDGDGALRRARVEARPAGEPADRFLVTFTPFEGADSAGPLPAAADDEYLGMLEHELRTIRGELSGAIEDLERSNEALRASNEEVTSINEELQCTNEELETSKDELQSLNAELIAVNEELREKVAALEGANDDLRRAEQARREGEAHLRLMADSLPALVAYIDADRRFRFVNRAYEDWFGRPRETMIGRLVREIVGRRLFRHMQPHLEITLGGSATSFECRPRHRHLGVRHATCDFVPDADETGRVRGVFALCHDITDFKRTLGQLEALNGSLEQRVAERTAMLELLEDVASTANEGQRVDQTVRIALERLADYTGWPLGHVYWIDDVAQNEAAPSEIWIDRSNGRLDELRRLVMGERLASGLGMIGRVMETGTALWTGDVRHDERFSRRIGGGDLGVRAAIAFPVLCGPEVAGVVEFFSDGPIDPNEPLVELLANIGAQLGRAVERARAEWQLADAVLAQQQRTVQELHDGLGQELTGLGLLGRALAHRLEAAQHPERELAARLVAGIQQALGEVRLIARGLSPVDAQTNDLTAALDALCVMIQEQTGITCRLVGDDDESLDDNVTATHLYRIAQEALNNAVKHARATRLEVHLERRPQALVLEVRDDGDGLARGETDAPPGAGLRIMRYRARMIGAALEVGAGAPRGTIVRCVLQLPDRRTPDAEVN